MKAEKNLVDEATINDDSTNLKAQKKVIKAQKKAEKLARLESKKSVVPITPSTKIKKPVSAGYDPTEVEKYWAEYWLNNQAFLPQEKDKRFIICIPPPNITGSLHIGHAMMISVEDCIVRYKRLNNYEVLFLPGLDHAGIATQNVVMKNLRAATSNVDRETFLKAAYEWNEKYGSRIYEQFNRMGTSLDYSRKRFTLDKNANRSVNVAFCRLYNKGLIYRDNKIVAWCGKLKTTVSDLEVNYKDIEGGSMIEVDGGKYKFGLMYYVKYYLTLDQNGEYNSENVKNLPYVIVGTTRPETILGDSAICVNPYDGRFDNIEVIFKERKVTDPFNEEYKCKEEKLDGADGKGSTIVNRNLENEELKVERKNKFKVNKTVSEDIVERKYPLFAINPLTYETIPVIFDSQADLSFGTGILKVTPCHDPVDFKLGKKHNLKFNKISDDKNCIIHPKYFNMMRFEARKSAIEDLKKDGMFVKEESHDQILPFCSRSNDIIEFVVKEQWWCDCKGMARRAIESVQDGEIDIQPVEARSVWYRWLENIKDWCLSRQLWWGHRIPAYYASNLDKGEWIVAETEEEAKQLAEQKGYKKIEQDEDVLDTWFSSGLWPFSTMGWPDDTPDFKRYFPTSLLETGSDILFFWVARMVMLSYELTGERPFDKVFLHGIVRDAHGRKMSKSLGNVIDPLHVIDGISLEEMIENLQKGNLDQREVRRATDALKRDFPKGIQKCGADALRFTLLSYTNGMKDINLDILRVQGYSRLCNKVWNAYKFVSGILASQGVEHQLKECQLENASSIMNEKVIIRPHHKWIINRLNTVIEEQHRCVESYNFMLGTQSVYQLIFDFCDNIIEVSKTPTPEDLKVLKYVFTSILKLLNPYMPFITEEIHFKLCSSTISDYPQIINLACLKDDLFGDILNLAKICRSKGKIIVQNFDDISYLKYLVRSGFEICENLDEYETIGSLKYKIVN